jgi:hypothetical protein
MFFAGRWLLNMARELRLEYRGAIGLIVPPFQGLGSIGDGIPRASLRFTLGYPVLPLRGGGRNLPHIINVEAPSALELPARGKFRRPRHCPAAGRRCH